jgi:hypothetical protein
MSLPDDLISGTYLASLHVHQMILNILIAGQVQPSAAILEMLEHSLLALERTQSNAAAQGDIATESAAKGPRFHVETLRNGVESFARQIGKHPDQMLGGQNG